MERFRNAHTSPIDGVAPGEVGEWPPSVVRPLIAAGHLVPADGSRPRPVDGGGDTLELLTARFDRAWAEREAEYARELAAKDARITELTTIEANTRELLSTSDARVAALEAELAQAKRDLDAATEPKSKPQKPAKTEG